MANTFTQPDICFLPNRTYATITGIKLTYFYGSEFAQTVNLPYAILEFDGEPVLNVFCGTQFISLKVNGLISAFDGDLTAMRTEKWETFADGYIYYFRGISLTPALELYKEWH